MRRRPGLDCRVSVADIEHDGPFSTFDGIDRTAVLLEGPGLLLQGAAAGESVRFEHVAAVNRFAGETPLVARLPGTSARLFNVMHRRSAFVAQADAHRADGGKLLDRDCTTVVLAYAGRFDLSFEGETDGRLAITLSSGSGMVVFDRRASLDWRPRQENGLLIIVTLARG